MRVLADLHHEHLYESLRILFEDRMGWELYRPIGLEWYHEGYWLVYDHISTAQQYLSLNIDHHFRKLKPKERLGGDRLRSESKEILRYANWHTTEIFKGVYTVETPVHWGTKYKAITLNTFKKSKFDIILCSMPDHIKPYKKLQQKYQPNAKLIFQAGNNWSPPPGWKNILTSAKIAIPPGINSVHYHQEFDLSLFSPQKTSSPRSMYNMMHYLQESQLFKELENLLPDWNVKAYGAGNRDESRGPETKDIAAAFHEMGFLWHVKKEGDGYGYNLFHAAATGTPCIVKKSYLKGMTAEPLLIDGVTCIDLDKHSLKETIILLENAVSNYEIWSNNVYENFRKVVNFDTEAEEIKKFLNRLI